MDVLGIDFGTSNTVGVLRGSARPPRVLAIDGGSWIPSAIFVGDDATLSVGRDAERSSRTAPERFEANPKRRIDDGDILLGARVVPVVDAIAAVLRRVAEEARRQLNGRSPDEVHLTHPAQWGSARQNVLLAAARAAGLGPSVTLVPEPVAAAAHFASLPGKALPTGAALAVYDLGGGTFDVAVVGAGPQGFTVLAESGLADVGGVDFDQAIVDHLGRTVPAEDPARWQALSRPRTASDRRAARTLREDVRAAKETLSRYAQTDLPLPDPFEDTLLTRREFDGLIRPVVARTVDVLDETVKRAGLRPDRLAGVYLVGGSSRIPLVAAMISDRLGIVATTLDQPETSVAMGAALVPGRPQLPQRTEGLGERPGIAPGPGSTGPFPMPGPGAVTPGRSDRVDGARPDLSDGARPEGPGRSGSRPEGPPPGPAPHSTARSGFSGPVGSGPVGSGPVGSGPVGSGPVASGPFTSGPGPASGATTGPHPGWPEPPARRRSRLPLAIGAAVLVLAVVVTLIAVRISHSSSSAALVPTAGASSPAGTSGSGTGPTSAGAPSTAVRTTGGSGTGVASVVVPASGPTATASVTGPGPVGSGSAAPASTGPGTTGSAAGPSVSAPAAACDTRADTAGLTACLRAFGGSLIKVGCTGNISQAGLDSTFQQQLQTVSADAAYCFDGGTNLKTLVFQARDAGGTGTLFTDLTAQITGQGGSGTWATGTGSGDFQGGTFSSDQGEERAVICWRDPAHQLVGLLASVRDNETYLDLLTRWKSALSARVD